MMKLEDLEKLTFIQIIKINSDHEIIEEIIIFQNHYKIM